MKQLYKTLKIIKDEMQCFDIEVRLGDSYVNEEMHEYFCVVIYSENLLHPVSIDLPTDEGLLEKFNLGKCLEHLKFELSIIDKQTEQAYYQHTNETVH
ncbi:hypothetical protein VPH5P1C_0239 [Vibrio phage 5P1c]|nr:hypothetical protein VP495E541_P0240 [Vibrio phage 495E54-1]CAH9014767.1 hypothetical protein VP496E541_P0240 [Vibrio phage 496E54-1]